ncbi:MAG: metal ABC transporter permease [Deltaproteobacteria bacterium]|nr:MAG: metal ABC transporter permease [Deltaproteobacteria bacterium]
MIATAPDPLWAVFVERSLSFWAFEYSFVVTTLLACVLTGLLGGVIGVHLVLQRLSLLGDTVGHATLPGLALAFLVLGTGTSAWLLLGGMVTAALGAWAVAVLAGLPRTRPDAALAIVLSVFFGAGLVILSLVQRGATASQGQVMAFLLGNAAAVTPAQLQVLLAVTVALVAGVVVCGRWLVALALDPGLLVAQGRSPGMVRAGFLLAIALAVVVSIRVVGAVLVAAMLIIPASTALLVTRRLSGTLALSAVLGALAGVLGAWVSYVVPGASTGPSMVLASAVLFAVTLAGRGLLRHRRVAHRRGRR